jgi:hypothetical protein
MTNFELMHAALEKAAKLLKKAEEAEGDKQVGLRSIADSYIDIGKIYSTTMYGPPLNGKVDGNAESETAAKEDPLKPLADRYLKLLSDEAVPALVDFLVAIRGPKK